MRRLHRVLTAPVVLFCLSSCSAASPVTVPPTVPGTAAPVSNVVVITMDGLRWQEMFTGAGEDYFKKDANGKPGAAEMRFWRETPNERRSLLFPFLWGEVAKKGQIFGDPSRRSRAHTTNGIWLSYPGYNEMFSGAPDPRVKSNDAVPNPNITVFEWLNRRPEFRGRVAAIGSWNVLPFILNVDRSHIRVGSGLAVVPNPSTDREREINTLAADLPQYWENFPFDAPLVYAAIDALRTSQPRVLYVMLGESDNWAHEGRYDLYLDSAQRGDRFIKRIWDTLQSLPGYAGTTTLLVTTDHGRGATPKDWMDHGDKVPAAESTWIAAIGPRVPPLGVREGLTVTTSQVAATIAAVVGEDFQATSPKVAAALPGIGATR